MLKVSYPLTPQERQEKHVRIAYRRRVLLWVVLVLAAFAFGLATGPWCIVGN